jgi:hypothetical protein
MGDSIYDTHPADVINLLAGRAHETALQHGFRDEQFAIEHILEQMGRGELLIWFRSTTHQAEIARVHSEQSEGLESIRKDPTTPDHHLPQYPNWVIEDADTIIRIFDKAIARGADIGGALLAKIEYNESRPYKHDKNS